MSEGVAQPRQPFDPGQPGTKLAQPDGTAPRVEPVIGVDVLAKERELAHAGLDQPARFGHHLLDRAARLGAAGIGHDAERAELVAALLHREERGEPAAADHLLLRERQMLELVLFGELGFDDGSSLAHARQELRQAVVALGAEHEVDAALGPPGDLLAFGLGHAAGDAHEEIAALGPHFVEPAELGEHLLARLLADMAGIEHDEIGVVDNGRRLIAMGRQRIGHAVAVIDIHLTAVGLNEELLGPEF